jgi:hypothetical protein
MIYHMLVNILKLFMLSMGMRTNDVHLGDDS